MIIAMPGLDGGRVLLLEDEIFIGTAIRKFLSAAGAKDVLQVENAEDAFNVIEDGDVDAAVLDIRLKRGTSYDVAEALTQKGVAIVFHSGIDPFEFAEAFPDAVCCAKADGPTHLVESLVQARKNLEAA